MAPKKDPTSRKATTSKKGKGRAQAHDETDSDPEYFPDDMQMFEEPPQYAMPAPTPKKRKGVPEVALFVDEDAMRRWEQGFNMKYIHIERGFSVEKEPFKKLIKFYKFHEKLTVAPEFCNVSIAREYYANAGSPRDGAVYVRGIWVQITSEIINAHLGTPDYPEDPIKFPTNEALDEALIKELVHPGAVWELNSKGEHKHIRNEYLKSDVKIWFLFVLSRLMPSSQITEVIRNRLFLISAIRRKRKIDVGRIILASIKDGTAQNSKALYFPLLIQELCVSQGVDDQLGAWKRMQSPIPEQLYLKYLAQDKELEQARISSAEASRGDSEFPTYVTDQRQQSFDFASLQGVIQGFQLSVENRFSGIEDRMDRLQDGVRNIDERMERMHEGFDNMQQEWTSQAEHMEHRFDDLSTVAQQQFEVLYHRQVCKQRELDWCNKMTVYYHSDSGPPKPTPTSAQLAGYRIPNLSCDMVSGTVHELPPGVTESPSLHPLPTFGRIPPMPHTPTFIPNPEFAPAARFPLIASGQPLQGPVHGPFHYVPQLIGVPSFATASLDGQFLSTPVAFGSPSSSAPSSSSQGVLPPS